MISNVSEWYEEKEHIEEMKGWDKGKLKIWEQQVTDRFPEGAKILDMGSGLGREAFILLRQGFLVTGLDISEYAIEKAKEEAAKKDYNVKFYHYDGEMIPFEDETFDVVIVWSQTFGLLYGDEYKKRYLSECKRVLKPRGLLSYSGHSQLYLEEHYDHCLNGIKFYPYRERSIYWESFTLEQLENYARQAGFHILLSGEGEIYVPEDGVILHCLCEK